MRIGLVELLLILCIASLTIGPQVAMFVRKWMRRAQKTQAAIERQRAAAEVQRKIEREELMHSFRRAAAVLGGMALVVLVYTLVLRPIETPPVAYTAPAVRETTAAKQVEQAGELALAGYEDAVCVRVYGGWVYLAAQKLERGRATGQSALVRLREDGSGLTEILTVEGEITAFDFDAEGDVWLTTVTEDGGALCRAGHDGWGAALEQIVTQMDGTPLTSLSAVAVGADGKVYFAQAAAASAGDGMEAALRTELFAHTATGWVYVYDPAARSVERVLGGVAGAAGLALSPDGATLYVSDLGERCIWAVEADSRERTAGGKGCEAFAAGLPGYPATLAVDEDGTLYVAYRWAQCAWLESHADSTFLRGVALRARPLTQNALLGDAAPAVEALGTDGGPLLALGSAGGSVLAVYPSDSRVYWGAAGESAVDWLRI